MFRWFTRQSEVEFLREQVKELQTQVLVMASKHSEYLNTKIAMQPGELPKVLNPITGLPEALDIPKTAEERKEYTEAQAQLQDELRQAFGG